MAKMKTDRNIFYLLLLITFCLITNVFGYGPFREQIPNGNNVPHPCKPNYKWNGVGHQIVEGGGSRNPFGLDFAGANKKWTKELCEKDSDSDGKSNGEELGDPSCVWTKGAVPFRTDSLSHPGVCEPVDDEKCQAQSDWVNKSCEYDTFNCPGIEEKGVQQVSLRFPPTNVPAEETTYICMEFDLDTTDDFHLIATKPIIDNANVMHHAVVFGCVDGKRDNWFETPKRCGMVASSECSKILSIWTLGIPGECFHDQVGFRIGSQGYKSVVLQFHWNNPNLVDDYVDESGMTLYYTANKRKYDAGILTIGADYLNIPPLTAKTEQTSVCPGSCSKNFMNGSVYVVSAFNHMHYLGKSQKIELFRNGVKIKDITDDPEYNYDSPVVHEQKTAIEVQPGDTLSTTCAFDSQSKDTTTYFGDATSSEMCYGFITYYPKENLDVEFCTAWEDLPNCFFEGYLDMDTEFYKGCDVYNFRSLDIDDFKFQDMFITCNASCLSDCKTYLDTMFEHPCMNDTQLRTYMMRFWTMYGYARILDLFKACYPDGIPTLHPATDTTTKKSNSDGPTKSNSDGPTKSNSDGPTKSTSEDPTADSNSTSDGITDITTAVITEGRNQCCVNTLSNMVLIVVVFGILYVCKCY